MLSIRTYGKVESPSIFFLHGFLGCKEDWHEVAELLQKDFFCICIDLLGHRASDCNDLIDSIRILVNSFSKNRPAAVGYSLGGRILLELAKNDPLLFSSYFLLSSHPGLSCTNEREQRQKKEEEWLMLLQNSDIDTFLDRWYQQPLFSTLKNNKELFSEMLSRRKNQNVSSLIEIYEMFRLSKQIPIQEFPKNSVFFYGEYDFIYRDLYLNKNWKVKIEKIPQSGHAMHIETPKECAERIRTCLLSIMHQ